VWQVGPAQPAVPAAFSAASRSRRSAVPGRRACHNPNFASSQGPYGDAWCTTGEAVGEKRGASQMTAIARIVRRVASMVDEMNYAQRRTMELFLGLDENRR
jgi:hypothetical protein